MPDTPQITPKILVTTDFTLESERAFLHALALAVARRARLTLLHTGSESREQVRWDRFPGVRDTLTEWGLLQAGAPRSAVADELGVAVQKMAMRDEDPREGITEYLRKHPTDLLVMATDGRSGLGRLRSSSVAETVSYRTRSHALMLPRRGRGFVDPASGRVLVQRVLCAFEPATDPRAPIAYLAQWLPAMGTDIEVTYFRPDDQAPIALPRVAGIEWHALDGTGEPDDLILQHAERLDSDLVVMPVAAPAGLFGIGRARGIDRVLQTLHLPLLALPTG